MMKKKLDLFQRIYRIPANKLDEHTYSMVRVYDLSLAFTPKEAIFDEKRGLNISRHSDNRTPAPKGERRQEEEERTW